MGCLISYERGDPETGITEGHERSLLYPPECSLWCYMRPFAPHIDHEEVPNNKPVDSLLSDQRQLTPQEAVFTTDWQSRRERTETWTRDVAQLAFPERSHQFLPRTYLSDSPALVVLGGLENRILHRCGGYHSRQRSLSPGSRLEVDTLRRQIRRIRRALENSHPSAQSRFPLVINDLEPDEQLTR